MNTNPEKGALGRVFVVGAHRPDGGTYMAYQIGKLVCENWGHEFVSVEVSPEEGNHSVWAYEYGSCKVTMEEMMQQASRSDVLICNPSFSSFMWGLSFPGRKLMYVQDMKTYAILDGFFDKYVAVSPFVGEFLRRTYGMAVPVVDPFIHHDHLPDQAPAWKDRPERSMVVGLKAHGDRFLDHFNAVMKSDYPDLDYSTTIIPPRTPQQDFMKIVCGHRYFLWLSAVEGFGLPPLEAMMCGAAVAGFHGGGGNSYFRSGWKQNALVCGYPDFRRLAALFAKLLTDDGLAEKLSRNGRKTASGYTYKKFKNAWIKELASFFECPPESTKRPFSQPEKP